MMRSRSRAVFAVATLVAIARVAGADDEIARGSVVRIEAKEIYVSLGRDRGVVDGAALRLKRPIALHHPVTHAAITDWVPIGSASVTQAGAVMSRAVVGELVTDIKIGDLAEILIDRPDAPKPPAEHLTPALATIDPATAAVLGEFAAQANQPLEVRIAGWERYLSVNGGSPYAESVRRDLDALHALRDQMRPASAARGAETIATAAHQPRKTAHAGVSIPVVFVLDQPDRVASAYLHYRPHDARTYRSVLLAREQGIYLRGAVPADVVAAPGVDYFVEVSTPAGRSGLALGTPADPIEVEVRSPPLLDRFGSGPGRSSVRITADALDFQTLDRRAGDHTDRMLTANVDFTYQLSSLVESIGVGYGVFAGEGGLRDAVWDASNPAPVSGFHYGYADTELGGRVEKLHLSVGGQLIAGVGKAGFGMGGEGRIRIGDRDGMNLLFSGRTIDQVGYLSEVRFGTWPLPKLGVALSVGATNQPDRAQVGAKLGSEIEIAAIRNVSFILRGSWQGRSVAHAGLGAGGGLVFTW